MKIYWNDSEDVIVTIEAFFNGLSFDNSFCMSILTGIFTGFIGSIFGALVVTLKN